LRDGGLPAHEFVTLRGSGVARITGSHRTMWSPFDEGFGPVREVRHSAATSCSRGTARTRNRTSHRSGTTARLAMGTDSRSDADARDC
jgi:hypothetical protein